LINYLIGSILTLSLWQYLVNLAVVTFGRSLDILSTWWGGSTLEFEGNKIVRRLGWRNWILLNVVFCLSFALWFNMSLLACILSALVAADNLNQLWVIHIVREPEGREALEKLADKVDPKVKHIGYISYGLVIGAVGAIILYFGGLNWSKPMTWIGLALIGYALTIVKVRLK